MKKALSLSFATLIATAALSFAAVKTGEAAPDFKLKDYAGKEHALADFKGKFVVLEWVNHGCPFVKKHYDSNNMQGLQKDYTAKDVVWLSICSSAPGKQGNAKTGEAKETGDAKGAKPTSVLNDESGDVGRLYGARTTPQMYVINPEGKLIYQGAIDSDSTPDPKAIAGATNYVKAALDEAIAGKPVTTAETKSYGCSVKYAK